jgi:hypothetical protein
MRSNVKSYPTSILRHLAVATSVFVISLTSEAIACSPSPGALKNRPHLEQSFRQVPLFSLEP